MRTFPTTPKTQRNKPAKKPATLSRLDNARRLVHEMINQLSVINLYSFKIRASCRHEIPQPPETDLLALERAVKELVQLAERLSHMIVEQSALDSRLRAVRARKSQPKSGNVYHLFEP